MNDVLNMKLGLCMSFQVTNIKRLSIQPSRNHWVISGFAQRRLRGSQACHQRMLLRRERSLWMMCNNFEYQNGFQVLLQYIPNRMTSRAPWLGLRGSRAGARGSDWCFLVSSRGRRGVWTLSDSKGQATQEWTSLSNCDFSLGWYCREECSMCWSCFLILFNLISYWEDRLTVE